MKNLFLLPTDKPSRLSIKDSVLILHRLQWRKGTQNIYITNDEEIKEGDWVYDKILNSVFKFESGEANDDYIVKNIKKIILTTDQNLIKDGVQDIDDDFLEWFVKNPSCEFVKIEGHIYKGQYETEYKIIIPKEEQKKHLIDMMKEDEELGLYNVFNDEKRQGVKELIDAHKQETPKTFKELFANTGIEPTTDENGNTHYNFKATMKQETIEEAAERFIKKQNFNSLEIDDIIFEAILFGAKLQKEQDKNKYSDEEVVSFIHKFLKEHQPQLPYLIGGINMWFEQFKKK